MELNNLKLESYTEILGLKGKDKITGLEGVLTSVSFDLYGCIQVVLHPGLDDKGKFHDSTWFDINRIELLPDSRVMKPPVIKPNESVFDHDSGAAEKPVPNN